ncbi:hypothetical protein K438DRAFT_1808445 [Mycena galopus ATCC 62051]|nr:hypothetical protein K438DRAFT_1808445 [Mycena galopus ATCC 62051]
MIIPGRANHGENGRKVCHRSVIDIIEDTVQYCGAKSQQCICTWICGGCILNAACNQSICFCVVCVGG